MPRTVLRSATKRPVRYSAKWRRWHSLAKRSPYWARASLTSLGNSIIPGMSRCSAIQLRQGKTGRDRAHLPYSYRLDGRFAKSQLQRVARPVAVADRGGGDDGEQLRQSLLAPADPPRPVAPLQRRPEPDRRR